MLFKNLKLTYFRGNYDAFESTDKEMKLVQQRQHESQMVKVQHMQVSATYLTLPILTLPYLTLPYLTLQNLTWLTITISTTITITSIKLFSCLAFHSPDVYCALRCYNSCSSLCYFVTPFAVTPDYCLYYSLYNKLFISTKNF